MRVEVRLFAGAREAAGTAVVVVELPEGSTVGRLREQLAAEHPRLRAMLGSAGVSVGLEYATDSDVVPMGVEIAVIPPVSGGSGCQGAGSVRWSS